MSVSAEGAVETDELILYLEPGGVLGDRCADFWAGVSAAEATTSAQEYPPHLTLTGFFRRMPEHVERALTAMRDAADSAVPAGLDGTRWAEPAALEFQANDGWIGLHVAAPWMDALIAAFAAHPLIAPEGLAEDDVRPKSWLHVSLAYGERFDAAHDAAGELAAPFADLTSEAHWTLGVWRRTAAGWERLAALAIGG